VFPEKMRTFTRPESYCPVSVMKLEALPSIGDYIQVMKMYKDDRDLYRIVSKCLTVESSKNHVIYDFEVERVEEGNQKAIL
jgi:protein associated with RNAse G/E